MVLSEPEKDEKRETEGEPPGDYGVLSENTKAVGSWPELSIIIS